MWWIAVGVPGPTDQDFLFTEFENEAHISDHEAPFNMSASAFTELGGCL